MSLAHDDLAPLPDEPAPGGLDDRDRAVLELERRPWPSAGAKEQAIRETLSLSSTRYYQVLNALIDTPEALAAEPALVKRLRRRRAERTRSRTPRLRTGI